MAYTAEEFERTAAVLRDFADGENDLPLDSDRVGRLLAALRIASAVMRPGVIEQAMFEFKYNDPPALADAIRAALTDVKP